jgi:hypothetical protein
MSTGLIETIIYTEEGDGGFKRTKFIFDISEIIAAYPESNPVGENAYCTSVVFRNGDSMLIVLAFTKFMEAWNKFREGTLNNRINFSSN